MTATAMPTGARATCDVQLTIVKGEALLALNPGGTSNPYVTATIGAQSVSTPVVNKSVNPLFNHTFLFKDCPLPAIMTLRVLNKLPYVDLEDPMGVATVTLFGASEEQSRVVPLGHGGNASLAQRAIRGCGSLHIRFSAVASTPMPTTSPNDQAINPTTATAAAAAAQAEMSNAVAPTAPAAQALNYPQANNIQGEPALPVATLPHATLELSAATMNSSSTPQQIYCPSNTEQQRQSTQFPCYAQQQPPPHSLTPVNPAMDEKAVRSSLVAGTVSTPSEQLHASASAAALVTPIERATPPSLLPPSVSPPAAVPHPLQYLVPASAAAAPASSALAPLNPSGLTMYTSYFVPNAATAAGMNSITPTLMLPNGIAAADGATAAGTLSQSAGQLAGTHPSAEPTTTTYYASNNAVTGVHRVATPPTTIVQSNAVVAIPVAAAASVSGGMLPSSVHTNTSDDDKLFGNHIDNADNNNTASGLAASAAPLSCTINPHDPTLLALPVDVPHRALYATSPSSLYTSASQAPAVQAMMPPLLVPARHAASAADATTNTSPSLQSSQLQQPPQQNLEHMHPACTQSAYKRDVVELSRAALPAVAQAPFTRPLSSGTSISRCTTPASLTWPLIDKSTPAVTAADKNTQEFPSAPAGSVTRTMMRSSSSRERERSTKNGLTHSSNVRRVSPARTDAALSSSTTAAGCVAATAASSSSLLANGKWAGEAATLYAQRIYLFESAASGRDVAIFHKLRMVDPLLTLGFTDCVNYAGSTLLHIAAWNGQLAIVQLLLGPYPDLPALDLAALRTTSAGNTILHAAACGGQLEVVHWLLHTHPTAGSLLLHLRNFRHMTAADCAKEAGFDSVARVLLPLGE